MYIHIYIYMHMYIHKHILIHMHMYAYAYVCVYIHTKAYAYVCIYMYMYVCMCTLWLPESLCVTVLQTIDKCIYLVRTSSHIYGQMHAYNTHINSLLGDKSRLNTNAVVGGDYVDGTAHHVVRHPGCRVRNRRVCKSTKQRPERRGEQTGVCVYVCMYVCMYVCRYIHAYAFFKWPCVNPVHMFIRECIHAHTYRQSQPVLFF